MRIKEATEADIAAIEALEQDSFPDPWPEEIVRRRLGDFLVLCEGEELFGYVCLSHVLDEGSIDTIAVAPAHRRGGLGQKLIDAAVARARELALAFIHLEVRAGNEAAIALYERNDFARVGLRRGYYQAPKEDAILMTRFL